MAEERVEEIIAVIKEVQEDSTVPKSIKLKLQKMVEILSENTDISIKVNKTLHELEMIDGDNNTDSFVRTQLMNIASMLENV
ncbi:TPA: hypothetical protein HA246_06570 [Candidatus Woesearchaeota archaeon]|nr:hypothetical protein [Candidatus Woesearchaeota archaeon]